MKKIWYLLLLVPILFYGCDNETTNKTINETLVLFTELTKKTPKSNVVIGNLPNNDIAAICYIAHFNKKNEYIPPKIVINRNFWVQSSKKFKQLLILHELGHCEFGLPHTRTTTALMYYYISLKRYSQFEFDSKIQGYLRYIERCGNPNFSNGYFTKFISCDL